MNASKSTSQVFDYLVSLVTVFAVLNWVAILFSHIRFRRALKAQGIALSDLPYVGIFQPYGSYFALFISLMIVIFNGKFIRQSLANPNTESGCQVTMHLFRISKSMSSF